MTFKPHIQWQHTRPDEVDVEKLLKKHLNEMRPFLVEQFRETLLFGSPAVPERGNIGNYGNKNFSHELGGLPKK